MSATEVQVRVPAEWEPHAAVWLAWPAHPEWWFDSLSAAQAEFAALVAAIADRDTRGHARGERVEVLVCGPDARPAAEAALAGAGVRLHTIPYGDVWARDTGPIFVETPRGPRAKVFAFNGWGEKYIYPHDDTVGAAIAATSGLPIDRVDWILEGGALDFDGAGTCLTTESCLLNPNRNPTLDRAAIERALTTHLGARRVLWLGGCLLHDHTDGHIDTLARFVAPGVVLCMRPSGPSDPNAAALTAIERDLRTFRDAAGRPLEVRSIPSPGTVLDPAGNLMPASYTNFYIGNTAVVVPTYGSPHDAEAVAGIAACFPGRRTVGLSAHRILEGGGAFHCITQQQPAARGGGAA